MKKWFLIWVSILPLFFPLYLVRFSVGGVPTTFLEVLVALTLMVGVIFFVRPRSLKEAFFNLKKQGLKSMFWPILLFVGAAIFSTFIVPKTMTAIDGTIVGSQLVAFGVLKGWILMPIFYFAMIRFVPWTGKDKKRMLVALALSGFGLSLWAIYQMVTGDFITWDGRASGPFESANYLALYLGPILVMCAGRIVQIFCSTKKVLFWLVLFFVMAVAFWGTQSYAAFIAFFVGTAFYGLFSPAISRKFKLVACLGAFVVATGFFVTQMNTAKFQSFLDFDARTSSSVRIEVYRVAWGLIESHPVAGIGLGQFQVQYALNAPTILGHSPYEWVMLHPHNLGLAFWLNTGLFGVLAMAWLLMVVFFGRRKGERAEASVAVGEGTRSSDTAVWKRALRLVGLAMMITILTHGLFDVPFFKNDLAYLWWLVVGLSV
ncbi:MAG: O-antigen ligase family protein [Candidatus Gracilibacteria bacterium]